MDLVIELDFRPKEIFPISQEFKIKAFKIHFLPLGWGKSQFLNS